MYRMWHCDVELNGGTRLSAVTNYHCRLSVQMKSYKYDTCMAGQVNVSRASKAYELYSLGKHV